MNKRLYEGGTQNSRRIQRDFHWFDADLSWFDNVERRIASYRAIHGSVETEISRSQDIGAGCGCAYPATVADETVQRSNQILRELREVAQIYPDACR